LHPQRRGARRRRPCQHPNHSGYDDSLRKMEALQRGNAQNPFVIGHDAVVRGLKAMERCAKARRDRFVMG
jgi:hypothetical protein